MERAKDLLNDKALMQTVEGFFGNKTFYYELTNRAREVVEDGKLDASDIPNLLLLVTTILNKTPSLKVKPQNMKPLLKAIIVKLLVEVKFVNDGENPLTDEQEMYIDSGLALLGTKVSFSGCLQWLKDVICGCLNDEDSIVSEFLSKQKATRGIVKAARETGFLENDAENDDTGDSKDTPNQEEPATEAAAASAIAPEINEEENGEENEDVVV